MRLHTKQWLSYADFALSSLMWTVLVYQHAAGRRFRLMTEHRISALKVLPRDIILQLLPSNTFHKIRQGRRSIRIASTQGFSNLWTRLTVRNSLSIIWQKSWHVSQDTDFSFVLFYFSPFKMLVPPQWINCIIQLP